MRRALAVVGWVLVLAATGTSPQAQERPDDGASALAREDYTTALTLFGEEAAAGSGRAQLALGLMHDLGLGVTRDLSKAFEWYQKAAAQGIAQAQFNAGVMLDSGLVSARDAEAAAVLYARAAINGSARGQYNLALLYQAGEGVPQNPDLARYWLERSADALPAAASRLAGLQSDIQSSRDAGRPERLYSAVIDGASDRRAELVWSAQPGPEDSAFLVEIRSLPRGGAHSGRLLMSQRTQGSAMVVPLPGPEDGFAWRVHRIGPEGLVRAASEWQLLGRDLAEYARSVPKAHVTLTHAADDTAARTFARELAGALSQGGLWVDTAFSSTPADATSVTYFFEADAPVARSVAAFLPVLTVEDANRQAPAEGSLPGEIRVHLVGGPSG